MSLNFLFKLVMKMSIEFELDDEVGDDNFVAQITVRVKSPLSVSDLARTTDFILWYGREKGQMKFRQPRVPKVLEDQPEFSQGMLPDGSIISRAEALNFENVRMFTAQNLGSSGYTPSCMYDFEVHGRRFSFPKGKSWKTHEVGMGRLLKAGRLHP